ncbi:MAG TPA: plastocyanin/azurin family copper-binding protein [Actinomycetes bacterium]|jgi:plastocyanin|nr:plastocyanin/azurin family copper-binding protein [Actinomycetes bacterium]
MSTVLRRLPRLVLLASVLAALGAVLLALAASPVAAQSAQAQGAKEIDGTADNKWVPSTLTIQPGQSVTFKVAGGATHPVGSGRSPTAKDNRFDASKCQLAQMSKVGDSCTVKFPKAGSYPFFCEIHYALGMTGTIQVGKGGPGTTTTAPSNGGGGSNVVAPPSTGAPTPPGRPVIYYAGYGLVAGGVLLALFAFASYIRYAPSFRRENR